MRDPRLSAIYPLARVPDPLVAVAHGSKDPRAAAAVHELLSVVRSRAADRGSPGLDVRAAFLDHCAPSLPQVLASRAPRGSGPRRSVVVPLLLTAAYHSKSDIPARIAAALVTAPDLDAVVSGTLGPHPLLLAAMERRLAQACAAGGIGLPAGSPAGSPAGRAAASVVLAAAGSSDPDANATIADLAAAWRRAAGWRRVVPAYASAAHQSPAAAVAAVRAADPGCPVLVASYLLAPGYFADKIRGAALEAGAAAVGGTLGAAAEVAEVVLDRYAAAEAGGSQSVARVRPELPASNVARA